jgi:hypothetical protein
LTTAGPRGRRNTGEFKLARQVVLWERTFILEDFDNLDGGLTVGGYEKLKHVSKEHNTRYGNSHLALTGGNDDVARFIFVKTPPPILGNTG